MELNAFLSVARGAFPFLTPEMEAQFAALDGLYREWNAKINVISRKDIDALYEHHVLHSLAIARYLMLRPALLEAFQTGEILDLGTGGGFPGIPLAILFPGARFTLCDSIGKKIVVAEAVAKSLGLKNVTTVNARAESLGRRFDFVVSRAVASLEDLYPWVKGRFRYSLLLLKGGESLAEETARARARYRLSSDALSSWPVDAWLSDAWFSGKVVLEVSAGLTQSP